VIAHASGLQVATVEDSGWCDGRTLEQVVASLPGG
jgi:hypothetical protein